MCIDQLLYVAKENPQLSRLRHNDFANRFHIRARKNSLFNVDLRNFEYTRILSEARSKFQHMHADFAATGNYL